MGIVNFNLPSLDSNTLDDRKEMKRIKEYLYQLTEQLKYTLMNLDSENMSGEFTEQIDNTEALKTLSNALASINSRLPGFGDVKRSNVIGAVNASTETDKISAGKVDIGSFSGNIPLLSVSGSNIEKSNYADGTLFLLGITPSGEIKLCSLTINESGSPSASLTISPTAPAEV